VRSPATTCASVSTRPRATTKDVPSRVTPHPPDATIFSTDASAFAAIPSAPGCDGTRTLEVVGEVTAANATGKTSVERNAWARATTDGTGGITESIAVSTADPWMGCASQPTDDCVKRPATSQALSSAPSPAIAAPPTESIEPRCSRRMEIPAHRPSTRPPSAPSTAAPSTTHAVTTVRATSACRCEAIGTATTAPIANPATKPARPSSWVSAPSDRPRSAASATQTMITASTQLTARRVDPGIARSTRIPSVP